MNRAERDAMITGNIGLVVYIARKFHGSGVEFDELVSVGMMGLIKAADRYNPERGAKFSTFAITVVSNEMRMALRKLNRRKSREVSLDAVISAREDGRPLSLADMLCDKSYSVETDIEAEADRQRLYAAIEALNGREQTVIRMRYGIGLDGPRTQAEVAERIGRLSQSYVSRVEKKALKRMRAMMAAD